LASITILSTDRPCLQLGMGLACFTALLHVTTLVSVVVGLNPGWPAVVAAGLLLLLLGVAMLWQDGSNAEAVGWSVAVPIALVMACAYGSGQVMDASYDGLMYHQTGVLRLMSGWNPFRDGASGSIWVDAYPKASWLVGASLGNAFGTVEAMKAQNFALWLASGCLSFGAFRLALPSLSRNTCGLLAVLAAMNPVALAQLLTGYNDGLLGSGVTCLLALVVIYLFKPQEKQWLVYAVVLMPFVVNLKFTAVPYIIGLLVAGFGLIAIVASQRLTISLVLSLSVALVAAVFVLGFDPYVKNTLEHGHPFFPVFGKEKIDVMQSNLPIALHGESYLSKLMAGIFASPKANTLGEVSFSWWPHWRQFENYSVPDVRLAGFGPLFAMALVIVVVALALLRRPLVHQRWLLACAAMLALSGLINPQAWWARYVPQLWLALVSVVACLIVDTHRLTRRLGAAVAAVMLLNSAGVATASTAAAIWKSRYWETSLMALRDASQSGPPLRIHLGNHLATPARLDHWGVRYTVVSDGAACLNARPLLPPPRPHLSDARICQ
jgi:hypothetical protein